MLIHMVLPMLFLFGICMTSCSGFPSFGSQAIGILTQNTDDRLPDQFVEDLIADDIGTDINDSEIGYLPLITDETENKDPGVVSFKEFERDGINKPSLTELINIVLEQSEKACKRNNHVTSKKITFVNCQMEIFRRLGGVDAILDNLSKDISPRYVSSRGISNVNSGDLSNEARDVDKWMSAVVKRRNSKRQVTDNTPQLKQLLFMYQKRQSKPRFNPTGW